MENSNNLQPTINIGILGHVANGKSSLVRSLTGEKTSRNDSRCINKGTDNREITVQVGYSNAKIYKCSSCPEPFCYNSTESSNKPPSCNMCGNPDTMTCVAHVSFVDSPGHRHLMQNMMSGAAVMDAFILVVDSTCDTPQVQTMEHLMAAEIIGINKCILVVQNKIDLIIGENKKEKLLNNYKFLKGLFQNTLAEKSPIIPTCLSPNRQINKELILQSIDRFVINQKSLNNHKNTLYNNFSFFMYCVRSFDINKPGTNIDNLKGGIIGGTIIKGTLKKGDTITILPGYKKDNAWHSLTTTVTSLYTGKQELTEATTGGLIAIGTTLDPTFTRNDAMVGMCACDKKHEVMQEINVVMYLLKVHIGHDKEIKTKTKKLKNNDEIQLAIGSANIKAIILDNKSNRFRLLLDKPVLVLSGQEFPVSKMVNGSNVIIGKCLVLINTDTIPVINKDDCILDQEDQEIWKYDHLLNDIDFTFQNEKVTVLIPQLIKQGGSKLIWTNFSNVCKSIDRPLELVKDFFAVGFGVQLAINLDNQLVIHGRNRFTRKTIQDMLIKYIKMYVRCSVCNTLKTTLTRENRQYKIQCTCCGSLTFPKS